jgi:hypothetical protein
MAEKLIKLELINIKESPHVRSEYKQDTAEEYAEQYKVDKSQMPDCVLFETSAGNYLVADGMHRIAAMKLAGLKSNTFDVRTGSRTDCVKFALKCNLSHGIRRSSADKRACVELALREFGEVSNNSLSDACGVGVDLVIKVRQELESKKEIPKFEKLKSSDGREFKRKNKDEEDSNSVEESKVESGFGKDKTGYPHTANSFKYADRSQEVASLIFSVSDAFKKIKKAKSDKDLLYCEVNFNSIETDFERIIMMLKVAIPYAVCPSCQGQVVDKCRLCSGRGVISQFKYETGVSEELKKIRNKIGQ